MPRRRPVIGIALGSGSARGWSHIGVVNTLERVGITPDIVCGTSIGALVGAACADGQLDRLESWVRTLTWQNVAKMLDFTLGGGLIQGERLTSYFRENFNDKDISQLSKRFGAVATELLTGREVWLQSGSLIDAVRASIALPGLFAPASRDDRLLVDGGLVNPVPVSLCRAMGAEIVIAVELHRDLLGRRQKDHSTVDQGPQGVLASTLSSLGRLKSGPATSTDMPSLFDVLTISLNIMQVRIARSRLAGEPADVMIRPHLSDFAMMGYHRAAEAIDEGVRATEKVLPELQELTASRA